MARSTNLPQIDEENLLQLIGDAWLAYASEGLPEGCRLVLKEPSVTNLERFFRFFPRACLLVLMRDGRDIACSSLKTTFASPRGFDWRHPRSFLRLLQSPLGELARRWSDASRAVRAFLEELGELERARVVRYEDLVRQPEVELRGILDFLELSPEHFAWDSFAALDVRGSSFVGNRTGELDWNGRGSVPEAFEPVDRWRSWSEREIRQFRSAAGELLHWGYPDSDDTR